MLEKAKEHKHMTFAEAATMAKEANVQELWLTHYSPSLFKPKEYLDSARSIFPATIAAKDGISADLRYEEA
jgi:ribonuclease Z